MTGDHDDGKRAVDPFDLFQELHSVHARHLDIADDNARVIVANTAQCLFSRGIGFSVKSGQRQPLADRLPHIFFVVHNRDFHCFAHGGSPYSAAALCAV